MKYMEEKRMSDRVRVGLEAHVALLTKTKAFCGCEAAFGGDPNTRCCPVCLGLPGAMPTLNSEAVRLGLRVAQSLRCTVADTLCFDRKHYAYPDLPKGYQITQKRFPLGINGVFGGVRIQDIHLEEDAGKLMHQEKFTLADYNRCGVPLLEVVTAPDFASGEHAAAFLSRLRALLMALSATDGRMEHGSLRADVNVSTHGGEPVELKNLSSLRAVRRAVEYEIKRLRDQPSRRETRGWDEARGESYPLREKITYRYLPEPDLPEIPTAPLLESLPPLPETPMEREERYMAAYNLPADDARLIAESPALTRVFEDAIHTNAPPAEASKLLLRYKGLDALDGRTLGDLAIRIVAGEMTREEARMMLLGIAPEGRAGLDEAVAHAIAENEGAVRSYLGGKDKALMRLLGAVMRETGGRFDPTLIEERIRSSLHPEGK